MVERYKELDSLRGLAAISVLTGHFLSVFHSVANLSEFSMNSIKEQFIYLIKFTPLHILWGGHEAVIFFFVLSGFVLSLPFTNNEVPTYGTFLFKRVCRIYIPYYVAVLFSVIMRVAFSINGIDSLTYWFNSMWVAPITPENIIQHILLIGDFNSTVFDGTIWSLVHEMRISLIFPFIMLLVLRSNWKLNLLWSIVVSYIGCTLINLFKPQYSTNYFLSIHYLAMFVVGALLAKNRMKLIEFLFKGGRLIRIIVVFIGVGAYTYAWWFFRNTKSIHTVFINDWFICLGAAIFIIIALSSVTVANLLHKKPILLLGKMSYSIYLYHVPILLAYVYVFYKKIPMWSILSISLVSTLLISFFSYKYIEKFSVTIGKHISLKIKSDYEA